MVFHRLVFCFVLISVLMVGLSACVSEGNSGSTDCGDSKLGNIKIGKETGTRVEVAELEPSQARLTMTLPGEVEGVKEALLSSSIGGYVEKVHVQEGDNVEAGQVLADIDVRMHLIKKRMAKTELSAANKEYKRLIKLGDLAVESQLSAAKARVDMAKLNVEQANLMLSRSKITAPFSGVIAQTNLEHGEVIGPGQPAIRLIQLDPVIVNLSVSDRDITNLKQGMKATVVADARLQPKDGTLRRILPAGDLKTRTFQVEIEIPNSDFSLLPGMIASSTVSEVLEESAIVIPQDYIVTQLDGLGVFVEQQGIAKWRPLRIASVVGNQVVVESGVDAGEKIVVTGHRELNEGDQLLISRSGKCCVNGKARF